jgi:polyisoprenoid-binding protein YceI
MPPGLPNPLRGAGLRLLLGAFVATWAGVPVSSRAETGTTTELLDPVRSSADFEVKVLWLIGVHGSFGKVHGSVTIDEFRSTVIADAQVDVGAITMHNHRYEEWVKSDEFFDVGHYPQIRFLSDAFPRDRLRNGGDITGILTVRGIDKRVTLHVAPSACPQAVARDCPVEAEGTIRRSDFGMKSHRGTLADKVELGFSIYLATPAGETGPAK